MLKTLKNKSFALLALMLVLTMMISAMGIVSFADDGHDHDESSESSSEGSGEENKEEKTAFEKWWDSYNQIIGYVLAAVIFVAMVVFVIWWIPKDGSKKKSK